LGRCRPHPPRNRRKALPELLKRSPGGDLNQTQQHEAMKPVFPVLLNKEMR
jgi:hypothetical protein